MPNPINSLTHFDAANKKLTSILNDFVLDQDITYCCDSLFKVVQEIFSGCACRLLSVDDSSETLSVFSFSKNVPKSLQKSLSPAPIHANGTASSAAAHHKKAQFVSDLTLKKTSFLSCWAFPLFGKKKQLLGTFDLYLTHTKKPSENELSFLETVVSYISIILTTHYKEKVHAIKEGRLTQIDASMPGMIYEFSLSSEGTMSFDYVSDYVNTLYEMTPEEFCSNVDLVMSMHPSDTTDALQKAISDSAKHLSLFEWENRIILPSGKEKWIFVRSMPKKNSPNSITWTGVMIDTTEKNTLHTKFISKSNQLDDIINSVPGIIYEFQVTPNNQRSITYMSDYAETLFEVSLDDIYKDISCIMNMFSEDANQSILEVSVDSATNMSLFEWENKLTTSSGKEKWIAMKAFPRKNDYGTVFYTGFITEITEKSLLLLEHKKISHHFDQTQRASQVGSWEWDIQANTIWWSEEFYSIFNVSPDTFPATYESYLSLLSEDSQKLVQSQVGKILEDGIPFDHQVSLNSNSNQTLQCYGYLIKDDFGKNHKLIGTAQNITKSLAFQKENKKISLHFDQTQKASQIGSWEWDIQANTIWWSEETFNLFKVSKESIEMSYESYLSLLTTSSQDIVSSQVGKILEDGLPFEHIVTLASSEIEKLKGHGYLIRDDDGTNLKLIGTVQNITKEIVLENAHKVALRKNEASKLQDKIKSEFIANMNHEFRTPLNTILGFSQVLQQGILGRLNLKQQNYVNEILSSGDHLLHLINNILDLSKAELKESLVLTPVKLHSFLHDLQSNLSNLLSPKELSIVIECPPNLSLQANKTKLKQIVLNLLANAIQFSPNNETILIVACKHKNELLISVCDLGPGIAKKDHQLAFKAFHQLSMGQEKQLQGTGLGLYLVRKYMMLHNGSAEIDTSYTKGCCVKLRFPL